MRLSVHARYLWFALVACALLLGTITAYASDSFTVPSGGNQNITAHTVCQKVTNNSGTGLSVYVPTESAAEWQSFRDNPPAGVSLSSCITPGSQDYTTPGTYTFTVPEHNTLTVEVWGAGGGGSGWAGGWVNGGTGGTSSWNASVVAGGGGAAYSATNQIPFSPQIEGGTASGGDTNVTGGIPTGNSTCWTDVCKGGSAPFGGAGGGTWPGPSLDGGAPGGGGGVWGYIGYAGAAGGYAKKSYDVSALPPGSSIPVVVGTGGHPNYSGFGNGAPGRVYITWN